MPKGKFVKCQIDIWTLGRRCKRKALYKSYLHEPYFTEIQWFNLCTNHYNWLHRPEGEWDIDEHVWLDKVRLRSPACG